MLVHQLISLDSIQFFEPCSDDVIYEKANLFLLSYRIIRWRGMHPLEKPSEQKILTAGCSEMLALT
jgi:hypothetical protein